ncbi:hypothetical protein CLOAM1083 [Candidatus Cloacimonas acidaminovorans str. Evry]|uniref:Uncharacterized protein n=1 Tax=Cloacimonas acidaminovorans (strain Evry) TaxID=459349 RepID=B0VHX5_CLOAI|nr:hypothetical protein CLOAM1083 [Candidatus Cloacimonas acidaminovorans str. Evry]
MKNYCNTNIQIPKNIILAEEIWSFFTKYKVISKRETLDHCRCMC